MPQVYVQRTCNILFLLVQRELSSRGCGFAQPASPPQAVSDPNAPSPFTLPGLNPPLFQSSSALAALVFSLFSETYSSVPAA